MKSRALCLYAAFVFLSGCVSSAVDRTSDAQLRRRASAFLNAYAAGDKATVLSMLNPGESYVYATDFPSVIVGAEALGRTFERDMKSWAGHARFGDLRNVSTVRSGHLGTLFFDSALSIGDAVPMTIRFATVWTHADGTWKLIQSSTAVPTAH